MEILPFIEGTYNNSRRNIGNFSIDIIAWACTIAEEILPITEEICTIAE